MNTANENPDRYSVLAEATHILEGLHFAEEEKPGEDVYRQIASALVVRQLQALLVKVRGPVWMNCTIEQHTMPDGTPVLTASRRCKRCHGIHTFIAVVKPDGSFDFADPAEEE